MVNWQQASCRADRGLSPHSEASDALLCQRLPASQRIESGALSSVVECPKAVMPDASCQADGGVPSVVGTDALLLAGLHLHDTC